ncbi:hypothetical protein DRN69_06395 [Candidatus Pacearchaeota archaeon]|nr:MAG: hypothetical protein DRN69_06395 [Candidatus Pacearchaeota archaeon]
MKAETILLLNVMQLTPTKYRQSIKIIQEILEIIIRAEQDEDNKLKGILKSNIIRLCALKTTTAEKYLQMLEKAEYIYTEEVNWGERKLIVYRSTNLGKERYKWFLKINVELEGEKNEK